MSGHGGLILHHGERCHVYGCNAKAWVRAYYEPGDLFAQWCGHHAALKPDHVWVDAMYVVDERDHILEGD